MENDWQTQLHEFRDAQINTSLLTLEPLAEEDRGRIKIMLELLSEIGSTDTGEPLLTFNDKQVTPRDHIGNLVDQLRGDIYPILERNAPFASLRNIMCYAEYAALLRYGTAGARSESGNLNRLFGHFSYGRFERDYRRYASYLIQLYRHDLVHLTAPRMKVIQTTIRGTTGISVAGFSIDSSCIHGDYDALCSQMKQESFRSGLAHLRLDATNIHIHAQSLYFDLIHFLTDWQGELSHSDLENRSFAENFIAATLRSAVKVFDKPPIDQGANKHIILKEEVDTLAPRF